MKTNLELMKVRIVKSALAITEILIGLGCAAVGFYTLLDLSNCNPNAEFCVSLGMLPVLLFLVPGCVMATAGIVSYSTERFRFLIVQTTMIGVIFIYYASLYALALLFGS